MLSYQLSKEKAKTKTEALYSAIRRDIRNGTLTEGERLPAKRALAEHLGISVITVENAYALLVEEGYLLARPRSGYYVNKLAVADKADERKGSGKKRAGIHHLPKEKMRAEEAKTIPGFPRLLRRILSEEPEILSMKPPHLGCAVLRNAIADYLHRYRGMDVQPENIIVGSGAEYLYGLLVQLFGREQVYGIEDPSYPKIEQVYRASGAMVEKLKLGKDGIADKVLQNSRAKILHVTPFHSFPTNVTTSAVRRHAYLDWAHAKGAYLIEDDFASEFIFLKRPLETLYALDGGHRVIYMNTFSESIAPSIRTAYMVLPDDLLAQYKERLGFYSCTVPVLEQYVLARFIAEGHFERQLARKRRSMRV